MSNTQSTSPVNFKSWQTNPLGKEGSINYYFALVDLPALTNSIGESASYSPPTSNLQDGVLTYTINTPSGCYISDPNTFVRIALPIYVKQFDNNGDPIQINSAEVIANLVYDENGPETPVKSSSTPVKTSGLYEDPNDATSADSLSDYSIRQQWLQMDQEGRNYSSLDHFLLVFAKVPSTSSTTFSNTLNYNNSSGSLLVVEADELQGSSQRPAGQNVVAAACVIEINAQSANDFIMYKDKEDTKVPVIPYPSNS